MKIIVCLWIALSFAPVMKDGQAAEEFVATEEQRLTLKTGEAVQLSKRPGEGEEIDKRFTTFAMAINAPIEKVWEVVNDKKGAPDFLAGVLLSKVLEEGDDWMLVEQKTAVGGPKSSYHYTLRHQLYPFERVEFKRVSGELKEVLGGWWFFEGEKPETTILVYSLHIDPGLFAPQFIVKRGMKTSLPNTLKWMKKEALRRVGEGSESEGDAQ